jgi:hypothetical protein
MKSLIDWQKRRRELHTISVTIDRRLTKSLCAPGVILSLCILVGNSTLGHHARVADLGFGRGPKTAEVLPLSRTFACLPKDVRADDVVSFGANGPSNLTVEKKLAEMKARCRRGKLIDAKRREIRFFHPSCWGNPPPDYLEIKERENKELAKLRKRYTVIVFACNPMIQ